MNEPIQWKPRNQGIASLLQAYGRIYFDPLQATDIYTKQCSLNVTAKDLAVMAATLANGGVNPLTKKRIIDAIHCQHVLAVMITAGLYEISGDWLYEIGLPGKSGVSGGMVTIAPGKGGLGTFAPGERLKRILWITSLARAIFAYVIPRSLSIS